MIATSISRMVASFTVIAAACCVALFFAMQHVRREPPIDAKAVSAALAASVPASGPQSQEPAALAAAQAQASAVVSGLAGSPAPPDSGDAVPAFDIARIEPTGEAVIAGRSRPGATVELLRNGELHDRAVADQSGQFVMVPRKLPSRHLRSDVALQGAGRQSSYVQTERGSGDRAETDRPAGRGADRRRTSPQ